MAKSADGSKQVVYGPVARQLVAMLKFHALVTGTSVSVVAGKCGISPSSVTRFVSGQRCGISLDNFNTLGDHLGLWIVPSRDNFYYDRGVLDTVLYFRGRDFNCTSRDPRNVHTREFLLELLPRVQRNLSLRHLAKLIGVDHSNLWRFAKGQSSLSLDVIDRIFTQFGLELSVVIDEEFRTISSEAEWSFSGTSLSSHPEAVTRADSREAFKIITGKTVMRADKIKNKKRKSELTKGVASTVTTGNAISQHTPPWLPFTSEPSGSASDGAVIYVEIGVEIHDALVMLKACYPDLVSVKTRQSPSKGKQPGRRLSLPSDMPTAIQRAA